ncbi:MAG: ABC transporter substrate-binding protein, partial [Proteobacteria bacterium]|nr:ABC transporter substrate-binding protein [Pseudomonadota bacterium]
LCVGAIAAPAAAEEVPGVTKDAIKIGSFGPLTGPSYLYGKLAMNGIEVVFDEVNAQGGVHGRKLVLLREDDKCDAATGIAAAKKLIHQDQVFMIEGGGCSNSAIAAREEIEKAKVPWLVLDAVADSITAPVAPNIYTSALYASLESNAQLQYALEKGAKKIAIASMRDAWGRSRYEPMIAAFKAKGVTIAADEEIGVDANDATPQALKLKAAGADAVLLVLYPKPAAVFARDAWKIGYKPVLVGQTAIGDPAAFEEQVAVPGATVNFSTISMVKFVPDDPAVAKWRKAIEAKFPGDRLSTYNLFGVGSAKVVVEALKRAGPDLTREKFLQALGGLENFDAEVYGAPVTCKTPDHRCNKAPAWLKKEPGQPTAVLGVTKVAM